MPDRPRLSTIPLPSYRFEQHRTPHPTRNPSGHSWNKKAFVVSDFGPESWKDCEAYLHALDLFNHGFYWECHEALEDIWRDLDHRTPAAHHLQGMIQCTVAHWHARAGHASAVRALLGRIPRHVEFVGELKLGIGLPWLYEQTLLLLEEPQSSPLLEVDQD